MTAPGITKSLPIFDTGNPCPAYQFALTKFPSLSDAAAEAKINSQLLSAT